MKLHEAWLDMLRREDVLYALSERLGVEVYLVGVGDRVFLPRQLGTIASVATDGQTMAQWVIACIEHPDEMPWWMHTHPGATAWFSPTDEEGARRLYEAVRRPIRAIVLGKNSRHEELITARWVARHKETAFGYSWHDEDDRTTLRRRLEVLMDFYGEETFGETVMAVLDGTVDGVKGT